MKVGDEVIGPRVGITSIIPDESAQLLPEPEAQSATQSKVRDKKPLTMFILIQHFMEALIPDF